MTPFSLSSFLLALVLSSLWFSSFSQPLCHDDERFSLLQFKQSLKLSEHASADPRAYPKVASWASNATAGDCCKWDGVECDEHTGYVVGLDLSSSFLFGRIASNSSLLRLVHLTTLNLADNYFNQSRIPFSIKQLWRLTYLNLSDDGFSGQIPHEMSELSRLSVLDLSSTEKLGFLEMKETHLERLIQNMTKLEVLSLNHVNMSYVFPTFLANSSSLVSLNLRGCGLRGDFPIGILQLLNLQNLDLGYNGLTGELPLFNESSSLTVLNIALNDISGELPDSIGALSSLVNLDAHGCNLSGMIPQSIGKLRQLKTLSLSSNKFRGQIPSSLGNLTQLTLLSLSYNFFSGPPPDSFSELESLETLVLNNNELSGTINFDVFLKLKRLSVLTLNFNELTLLIEPVFNETSAQFSILDLSHCILIGFPNFLKHQTRMELLGLQGTGIGGPIRHWLMNTSTTTLFILDLSENSLTGEVSPEICSLKHLKVLDLSVNNLSGKIPPCLGNFMESLSVLYLNQNSFSGNIPEFGENSQLYIIDLSDNRLHGKLSRSLSNCNMLQDLALERNQLFDVFPHWVGKIPKLQVLSLRSNQLHGVIEVPQTNHSFPQLRIIDISENSFVGNFPSKYIQNWKAMKQRNDEELGYFKVAVNHSVSSSRGRIYLFDATIRIKGVSRHYAIINDDLALIDFSSNNFDGEIPEVIGELNGLHAINLSNNNFSGSIPLSFRNLLEIESLDLSRNALSGSIPEELTKLNFLQYFNVSNNFLEGPIPQANQLSRFNAASYDGNSGLCGFPLKSKCTSQDPGISLKFEQGGSFGFGWEVVVIGYACGFVAGSLIGYATLTARLSRFFR